MSDDGEIVVVTSQNNIAHQLLDENNVLALCDAILPTLYGTKA